MARSDVLDLNDLASPRDGQGRRCVLGNEGGNWHRAIRPPKGAEFTIILLRGGWSHLPLHVELDPADADWLPESWVAGGIPAPAELPSRRLGPKAQRFWPGGVKSPANFE